MAENGNVEDKAEGDEDIYLSTRPMSGVSLRKPTAQGQGTYAYLCGFQRNSSHLWRAEGWEKGMGQWVGRFTRAMVRSEKDIPARPCEPANSRARAVLGIDLDSRDTWQRLSWNGLAYHKSDANGHGWASCNNPMTVLYKRPRWRF